jgi:endonuclease I
MKKTFFFQFFLLLALSLAAQIPTGYYSAAEGKTEAALKSQLATIISANYDDNGYDGLYNIYKTSDNLPNGKVWDMYSVKADGTANYYFSHGSATCGSYGGEGDCYNREHTFCDSWLGNATPQRSDAHHLIPTDGYVNNRRSSFPHGKVKTASWTSTNGSKLGTSDPATGYSGTVFEPIDEYKGDFARMYFYVATRYESKIGGWANNGSANQILAGNAYPAYKSWFYTLMLAWNSLDPVSTKEINRNNVIYGFQNNRNPYIDYPDLAEFVWGNKKGQPWSSTNTNSPYLSLPTNGSVVDFGKTAYQQAQSTSVTIKANNLTSNLTATIGGTNASLFSISSTSITKTQAETGFTLNINYSAQTIGTHTATLQLSGGGITSVSVNLTAQSSDNFMALAATDISSNSFTAKWTTSAGASNYMLDVYSLQSNGASQTVKLLEEDFTSGLPTTWISEGYTDKILAGSIRLASGSNPGKITTPAFDLSGQNNVLTFKAKQFTGDAGAPVTIALNNQELESYSTTADFQTYTLEIPQATTTSTLSFSAAKGIRVYVDYVKVENVAARATPVTVAGYPKLVGNVLSYSVNGLESDSIYYYTVSPQNNSSIKTDPVLVKTLLANALPNLNGSTISWSKSSNGVLLTGLPHNCKIVVSDISGKRITSILSENKNAILNLSTKGVYIIQILTSNNSVSLKVVY